MPLGVEARVVGPDGKALPDDARGEIEVRGDNVMAGYYRAADETAKTLRPEGWLRTGDLGYRDSDGFYFITGRLKELIIKGGENIAPREIDEALLRHPAVLEGAAVGVPDRALRTGDPGLRRRQAGRRARRGGAARALRARARPLQDAEVPAHRRRAAEGPVGQGAAAQARGDDDVIPDAKTARCRARTSPRSRRTTRPATCARAAAASR